MDKQTNSIITAYKKKLELFGIRIKKIILYGSCAAGTARKTSDIDLVIISNDFRKMDIWDRLCLLGRARLGIKKPMEILGLTEKEFKNNGTAFLRDEIRTKGIELNL
ncbi:MAG: nucleotidyltransferase domain-containing protein [Planctomycetes bacterium]|nr:nucleotidyltransferase domain-containing protein [Planctomycetota bacterium]